MALLRYIGVADSGYHKETSQSQKQTTLDSRELQSTCISNPQLLGIKGRPNRGISKPESWDILQEVRKLQAQRWLELHLGSCFWVAAKAPKLNYEGPEDI